VVDQA
jgi:serine/threonine protein kinase